MPMHPGSSNRTFMELKFAFNCFILLFFFSSNRTFMELKFVGLSSYY